MSSIRKQKVSMSPVTERVAAPVLSVREKFARTRDELNTSLIERETEIDLTLTALIAQESILLIGPPGTAKSMLCEAVSRWVDGSKFTYLITKYTDPNELFGPYSLEGYKKGIYERLTDGYLPSADVCFIDEVFKGSSAILNTLLRAINERKFRNGTTDMDLPMRLLVGASNEVPPAEQAKELSAMFDRFLIRHEIKATLSKSGRHRLLALPKVGGPAVQRDHTPRLSTFLTLSELDQASAEALALPFTDDAEEALDKILDELQASGIIPTQRRQWKSVRAVQAFAWLAGSTQVDVEHLEILQDILWDDPSQTKTARDIIGRIANPVGLEVNGLIADMDEVISKIDHKSLLSEAEATTQLGEIGRKLKKLGTNNRKAAQALKTIVNEIDRIRLGRFGVLDS